MKLIATLLVAAAAAQAFTTVSIWKHPSKKQSTYQSLLNAQSRHGLSIIDSQVSERDGVALTDFNDELYTTSVTFGNGQTFDVDLDTGSSDVWIRGPNCQSSDQSCGNGQPAIDLSDSSIRSTGKTWQTSYGSGNVAGDIYTGKVSLDGVSATLNFGVSTSEQGFNSPGAGLWGLAFPTINEIQGGSFLQAASVSSLAFYFSNAIDSNDSGELNINGVDSNKFVGDIQYLPVSSQTYWQFDPSGGSFTINGSPIPINENSAIADTGTTLLLAPQNVADAINSAIGAGSSQNGVYSIDCGVLNNGPSITVQLGAASIVLSPREYVLVEGNGVCASGISSIGALGGNGPAYIFGDTFLRAAYSVYDYSNKRVGFAQARHPGTPGPSPKPKPTTTQAPVPTTRAPVPTTKAPVPSTAVTQPASTTTTRTKRVRPSSTTAVVTSAVQTSSVDVPPPVPQTSAPAGNCPHDACTPGGPLDSQCDECTAAVCQVDPYCCTSSWDGFCLFVAFEACDLATACGF